MKKLLPYYFFFCVFSLFSQQGIITGKIIDSKTKESIPYVNIICKNSQNKLITGGITNKNGLFKIEKLPLEKIFIEIQFIGYQSISKEFVFSAKNTSTNLGTLQLKESTTTLDEVEVQIETTSVVQKIDRKVVNIGKDLASAGTNALELMQNIPTVNTNLTTGVISMRGNDNVRVLVDGKPSNLTTSQLLKQIPSSSIKSVELITNPSAKYNPEGMSGIINIILKKNTKIGFNGTITAGFVHGINTRPTGNINLNYRSGKFNFYSSYNIEVGKYATKYNLTRTNTNFYEDFNFLDDSKEHTSKFGVDIYLDDKNTISLYSNQSFISTDFTTETKTFSNNNLVFHSPNLAVFDTSESTYNADYKLIIDDKGQELELEANYTQTKNPEKDFNRELINSSSKLYNYNNNIINTTNLWLFNLDYTKPISETAKVELGLEARTDKTINKIVTDQEIETANNTISPRGNTDFNYDRNIYSAYINYNKDFNKYSLQTGLRVESFEVNGLFSNTRQAQKLPYKDYIFTAYPSMYLTYFPNDKHEFQIGYSRRVDRPSLEQVSPIQQWSSPLTVSVGNQELEPQFSNSFELNYTRNLKTGYVSLGSFYRLISNQIGRNITIETNNTDRQLLSYQNYKNSNSYGLELYASFKPKKWWTVSPSSDLYVQNRNALVSAENISVKNTVFNISVSNSFKASKKLSFQLSSIYRGKNKNIQFTVEPYYMVNAGAKLSVLNGNGSISLRGTDIFDTVNLDFYATQPFAQKGNYELEISTIYFGFTYNFGSNKFKNRKRKEREKNEIQGSGGVL